MQQTKYIKKAFFFCCC